MGRFRNTATGVTVSVADGKDLRFADGWESVGARKAAVKTQTVAELRAEIKRRNEGRDEADLLPTDGKKADLISVIEADDETAGG